MKLYTVHAAPARAASVPEAGSTPGAAAPRPPVLLREGFSPWAFLFGPFWFAWNGLWWWAAGLLGLTVAAALLLPEEGSAVIGLALHVLAGMEARDALRARLARRGRPMVGVVAAPDLEIAWFRLAQERPDLVRGLP
ncbi:DUF2628 domain-containing protein [Falsiroseomonas sp. CW058]|uniref:DUF2628 domain-containing protein n=1 Tax=Falsiroseomonas sp. CW058 TaxID=3388664 RepID=UPI003D318EE7